MVRFDLSGMWIDALRALQKDLQDLEVLARHPRVASVIVTPGGHVCIVTDITLPPSIRPSEPAASPLLPAAAEAPAAVIPDAAGAGDDAAPAAVGPEPVAVGMQVAQAAQPRPWTEEEDRHAVEIAAVAVQAGRTRGGAVAAIAAQLDRTPAAVSYRLHTVLKQRLQQAIAANPPAPAPQDEPAPAPEPAPPVEGVPEPVAEPVADPVEAYLRGLQPTRSALKSALDLMEGACAGLDITTIAIRQEVSPKSVRQHFELLTNKRAFGREAVRDALRRICEAATVSP